MTSKSRRLAFTAGFVVLFALTLWSWVPGDADPKADVIAPGGKGPSTSVAAVDPAGTASANTGIPAAPSGDRQSYAIGLHDISGLSRETPPGTVVDLWVAWDPPITEKPQYQRLIPAAMIEAIQPPFVPEGPFTVMLSVPTRKIGDLLYADRYGAISATIPNS